MPDALDAVIDAMRAESERRAEKAAAAAAKRMAAAADAAAADAAAAKGTYTAADYQAVVDMYRARLRAAAIERVMPSMAELAAKYLPRLAIAMGSKEPSPLVAAAVATVEAYFTSDIAGVAEGSAEPFVREVLGMAITEPLSVTDMARKMREGLTGKAADAVAGRVRTALQVFDQTVINTQAKGLGFNLWLYTGPDDVVTRPFCDQMVNRVFPTDAIKESDNGQLPNVQMSRGGYNCRHRLRPVSATIAKGLGLPIISPYEMHTESVGKRSITYPVKA